LNKSKLLFIEESVDKREKKNKREEDGEINLLCSLKFTLLLE